VNAGNKQPSATYSAAIQLLALAAWYAWLVGGVA